MTVSAGSLDALIGISGSVAELYGVSLGAYTNTPTSTSEKLVSATVVTTGAGALGTTTAASETFKIAAVNDTQNTVTFVITENLGSIQSTSQSTFYALAFSQNAILLGSVSSNIVATNLDGGFSVDGVIGVFSTSASLAAGTTLSFSASGAYGGSPPSPPQNTVTVSGAGAVPAAISGEYNTLVVANAATNSVVLAPPGYQAVSVSGATAVSLVDFNGGVVLTAGAGNDTLLAVGSADTLQAGAGNNFFVAYSNPEYMTAAGQSGNNVFYGITAPITVQGGSGNDTAVMNSGGMVATGTGRSQVWLSNGSTAITSNGTDTIVAGSGAATVNVQGSSGALIFGGTGPLLINGGTGASTLVGFGASVTLNAGAGGGTFYGGSAGHNVLNSGSGAAILIGGGDGDVLTATGSANDVLVGNRGSQTLSAAGSSGNDALFGGAGSDCLVGGTGTNVLTAGPGNMTLVGGGQTDLFVFLDGATSATEIDGFNTVHDFIKLSGFAATDAQNALAGAHASANGTLMTLSDGTQINFVGIAPGSLTISNFA